MKIEKNAAGKKYVRLRNCADVVEWSEGQYEVTAGTTPGVFLKEDLDEIRQAIELLEAPEPPKPPERIVIPSSEDGIWFEKRVTFCEDTVEIKTIQPRGGRALDYVCMSTEQWQQLLEKGTSRGDDPPRLSEEGDYIVLEGSGEVGAMRATVDDEGDIELMYLAVPERDFHLSPEQIRELARAIGKGE